VLENAKPTCYINERAPVACKEADMQHKKTEIKTDIILHYFRVFGHDYLVSESTTSNRKRFEACVGFFRITSNVFGNGSDGVPQSGWRRLPFGPKREILLREVAKIPPIGSVAQTGQP
jgi:hypothetical protein